MTHADDGDLPLTPPVYHILLALVDAPRHGYAIMQEVESRTSGEVRLGPGTLYGAIKRLREQGLIEEREEAAEERRREYELTARGRALVAAEARRLERMVEAARAKRLIPARRPA